MGGVFLRGDAFSLLIRFRLSPRSLISRLPPVSHNLLLSSRLLASSSLLLLFCLFCLLTSRLLLSSVVSSLPVSSPLGSSVFTHQSLTVYYFFGRYVNKVVGVFFVNINKAAHPSKGARRRSKRIWQVFFFCPPHIYSCSWVYLSTGGVKENRRTD